jgi:hypothetical protein
VSRISGPGIDITIAADSTQAVAEIGKAQAAASDAARQSANAADDAAKRADLSIRNLSKSIAFLKRSVSTLGVVIGAAFGITKAIDAYQNRLERVRDKLDDITSASRRTQKALDESFAPNRAGGIAEQIRQISDISNESIKSQAKTTADEIASLSRRVLSIVGLAPTTQAIIEAGDEATSETVKKALAAGQRLKEQAIRNAREEAEAAELANLEGLGRLQRLELNAVAEANRRREAASSDEEEAEINRILRAKLAKIQADREAIYVKAQEEIKANAESQKREAEAIAEKVRREKAAAEQQAQALADAFSRALDRIRSDVLGQVMSVNDQLLRELVGNTEGLRNNLDRINNGVRGSRRIG